MTSRTAPGTTRRTFLTGAASVTGLGVLAACGPESASPSTTPSAPRADGALVEVADVPVGGSVLVTDAAGHQVLVARPDEGTVVAFSAICTHMGCTVEPDGEELRCPCHGSVYRAATGDNVSGPAPRPLDPVVVRVQDGLVVPG